MSLISNYLTNRKQRVLINSTASQLGTLSAGVPHGSELGPFFFLVYVNDITENLLSLTRLFADDSSLFFSATNIQDLEGILNHDLSVISAWEKQLLVTFTPSKTEAILFPLHQNNPTPSLFFENTLTEFVESHKHLGLTLSSNGNWHTHTENILKSGYKVLGIMRNLKYSFSRQALNQVYISYVRPVLEYSSVVWDGCTNQDRDALEKLQNEAARLVTGLPKSTSLANLYRECGWATLNKRRTFQKLCFMYRCVKGLVPEYIDQLIPPLVGEISDYNLRNASNLSNFRTRTEVFRQSCLPSAISLWNKLSPNIKQSETFTTFQHQLKLHLFGTRKVPEYFLKGYRFLSVMHARIRNQCSNLNGDLFKN